MVLVCIQLCHRVPRDWTSRIAFCFLLIGALLTFAAVGQRNHHGSLAILKEGREGQLRLGCNAITNPTKNHTVTVCDHNHRSPKHCNDFVYSCSVGAITGLLGCSLGIVAVIVTMAVITPHVRSSTRMFGWMSLAILIPMTCEVTSVAMYCTPTLRQGRVTLSQSPSSPLTFGSAFDVHIAGMCVMCIAFLLQFGRFLWAIVSRKQRLQKAIDDRDLNEVMGDRVVNDDWQRQKMMWKIHGDAVHDELKAAVPPPQQAAPPGSVASSAAATPRGRFAQADRAALGASASISFQPHGEYEYDDANDDSADMTTDDPPVFEHHSRRSTIHETE